MSSKQQVRVFLWAVPRSISTAFFRAMMNKTNCKVSFLKMIHLMVARLYGCRPNSVSVY